MFDIARNKDGYFLINGTGEKGYLDFLSRMVLEMNTHYLPRKNGS